MLEELEVLNGEMLLKFDSLNTKYTVILNNEDKSLNFQYKLKDGVNIEIEGNEALDDGSCVTITVFDDNNIVNYYFTIYREETEETINDITDLTNLEVATKKEVSLYAGPGIACICFLLILFLFVILFHKKHYKCKKM